MAEGFANGPGRASRAKYCILCADSVDIVRPVYVGPFVSGNVLRPTQLVNRVVDTEEIVDGDGHSEKQ